jgi:hypothetical protein
VGSSACSGCHAAIASHYAATPMARSSGQVKEVPGGEVRHSRAGVVYSMSGREMSFRKDHVEGSRILSYFLGAGSLARSFLIDADGFLFQGPVTYYSAVERWDLSPGYEGYTTVPLNRPVEPECLACHSGRLQPKIETQNGYRGRPFLEDGIGCERCHGPGGEHVRQEGKGGIVNPAKLEARRRDSICAECHLGGAARIFREGRTPGSFRPGEALSDSVAVFLPSSGHMEQLWDSACKKASGDRLWCGTCHDPHVGGSDYRQKCLSCHQDRQCEQGPDCISCHMPKAQARRIPHSAYSDHSIPRVPRASRDPELSIENIRPFWREGASDRETGLALAKIGIQLGRPELFAPAIEALQRVEESLGAEGALYLAVLLDRRGDETRAALLYARSLTLNPALAEAAVNLGAILASRGEMDRAENLWRDALNRNPGLDSASIKLASAQWIRGDREAARETLRKARQFVPDLR